MVMLMKTLVKLVVEDDIKYLCSEAFHNIEEILNDLIKDTMLKDQIEYCVRDIIKYYCNEIVRYVFNLISDIEEGRI